MPLVINHIVAFRIYKTPLIQLRMMRVFEKLDLRGSNNTFIVIIYTKILLRHLRKSIDDQLVGSEDLSRCSVRRPIKGERIYSGIGKYSLKKWSYRAAAIQWKDEFVRVYKCEQIYIFVAHFQHMRICWKLRPLVNLALKLYCMNKARLLQTAKQFDGSILTLIVSNKKVINADSTMICDPFNNEFALIFKYGSNSDFQNSITIKLICLF